MSKEVILVFPDKQEFLVVVDEVPDVGESVYWTAGTWTMWTVKDVVHTLRRHPQRGTIEIILSPKEEPS